MVKRFYLLQKIVLIVCLLHPPYAWSVLAPPSPHSVSPIPEYNLLQLDGKIKSLLDEKIAHLASPVQRLNRLHALLFSPEQLHIRYDPNSTSTAIDTFYARKGNCLSLANLFIASARHVNLKAKYQTVNISRQWRPQTDFFEVPGHINVAVNLLGKNATIEFNGAYYDLAQSEQLAQKIVTDERALAEFYNNLGVGKLNQGLYEEAIAYFEHAISIDHKVDYTWSNLGVAHKLMGNFKQSEKSYITALNINPTNNSIVRNIHLLYESLKDSKKSKKYAKKAEKHARKNPYYLAQLAEQAIQKHDYKSAKKLAKKAIKILKSEPDFFHVLATAYFYLDHPKNAQRALEQARLLSQTQEQKERFENKINHLSAN